MTEKVNLKWTICKFLSFKICWRADSTLLAPKPSEPRPPDLKLPLPVQVSETAIGAKNRMFYSSFSNKDIDLLPVTLSTLPSRRIKQIILVILFWK